MTTPNEGSINFPLFIDTHFYIYVFTKYFSEENASYAYAKKYVAYAWIDLVVTARLPRINVS